MACCPHCGGITPHCTSCSRFTLSNLCPSPAVNILSVCHPQLGQARGLVVHPLPPLPAPASRGSRAHPAPVCWPHSTCLPFKDRCSATGAPQLPSHGHLGRLVRNHVWSECSPFPEPLPRPVLRCLFVTRGAITPRALQRVGPRALRRGNPRITEPEKVGATFAPAGGAGELLREVSRWAQTGRPRASWSKGPVACSLSLMLCFSLSWLRPLHTLPAGGWGAGHSVAPPGCCVATSAIKQ